MCPFGKCQVKLIFDGLPLFIWHVKLIGRPSAVKMSGRNGLLEEHLGLSRREKKRKEHVDVVWISTKSPLIYLCRTARRRSSALLFFVTIDFSEYDSISVCALFSTTFDFHIEQIKQLTLFQLLNLRYTYSSSKVSNQAEQQNETR